jgi:2'-5' RNA ligase
VSETARLFVAACLPEAVCAELARWSRGAVAARPRVRRLAPESMHLTLCFLGEQPLGYVGELAGVLGGAAEAVAAVGELAVGAPLLLPPRRPRVLAVEIGDPTGTLASLRAQLVREIAAAIDWEPGRERFRPHVTVARMSVGPRGGVGPAGELPLTPQLLFACDKIALLRSHLEPAGARYEELASVGGW